MHGKQDISANGSIENSYRVLIIGMNTLDIMGICLILQPIKNVTILEKIKNDSHILTSTLQIRPDILIWHLSSIQHEYIQVIKDLSCKNPLMYIICILPKSHPRALKAFRNSGCHACILIDTVERDLRLALYHLEQGYCWISPVFAQEPCFPSNILNHGDVILNNQELAIAKLLVKGHKNSEISSKVGLTTKSVERYLTILYSKLNVRSKAEAVGVLISEGILFD
jgi:DNA-binding NarL/FixJ family response regulator